MFDKLSISNQLRWGILLLVMLCLLMSGGLLLYLSQQQQLQHAGRLQNAQAAAVARQIGLYAVDLTAKLKYMAKIQSLLQFPIETQTALLTALYQHHEAYDGVALFNQQGKIILSLGTFDSYLTKNLAPHSTLHQFLIAGEKNNKNNLFLPIEMDQTTGELISYFAVIIYDSLNKIDGLLVVRFNLNFLNFIVSQLNIGQQGYAYVLDENYRLIAYKDRLAQEGIHINPLDSFEDKPFLSHLKQSTRRDLLRYRGLNGDQVVGAIAEVPLMAWQVVTELPEREVQLELYTLINEHVIVFSGGYYFCGVIKFAFYSPFNSTVKYINASGFSH
jgi:two-component system, NtrC family, sensor kinase